ncbi:MAG: SDR family NAD(P)-dependent oxidoreductase, partial [Gemmatimonadetes bacterium]|nr:SDR family NAD(P)-dependent oxidoreductase [Gemmatimonadota bacterium]
MATSVGKLSDKTVVITGASSGLGATLAVECAKEGAQLALFARNAEKLQAVAKQCEMVGAEVLVVVGDV